jgi:hypothetical protein
MRQAPVREGGEASREATDRLPAEASAQAGRVARSHADPEGGTPK